MTWKQTCLAFEDRRCDRRHPTWKETLQQCAVFDMRGVPEDEITKKFGEGIRPDPFCPLPFPMTAIVHEQQTIVLREFTLQDKYYETEILICAVPFPDLQTGYWEIASGIVGIDFEKAPDAPVLVPPGQSVRPYHCVHAAEFVRTYVLAGRPLDHDQLIAEGLSKLREKTTNEAEDILVPFFSNALKFLFYLNAPTRYIVCETPRKTVKPKRDGVARIGQRPLYIVLDKTAIAHRYADSQPADRRSPMPHLRRGHYRTLTAERFKAKKGQQVWVRATNVAGNTVQWREGDRTYKVL